MNELVLSSFTGNAYLIVCSRNPLDNMDYSFHVSTSLSSLG